MPQEGLTDLPEKSSSAKDTHKSSYQPQLSVKDESEGVQVLIRDVRGSWSKSKPHPGRGQPWSSPGDGCCPCLDMGWQHRPAQPLSGFSGTSLAPTQPPTSSLPHPWGGEHKKGDTHTKVGAFQHPCPNLNSSKLSPPCSKTCKHSLCYCAGRHLPLPTESQEHGTRSRRVEVPPQPGKQWFVSPASHHCLFSLRLNPRLWLPDPPTPSSTAG